MQPKSHSLLEAISNLAAGIIISWLLTFYVLPVFDLHPSATEASYITLMFTTASIIRSYTLRRIFNRLPEMIMADLMRAVMHRAASAHIAEMVGHIFRPLVRWVLSRKKWTAKMWDDLSKTFSRFG